jgi:hypothetical protein
VHLLEHTTGFDDLHLVEYASSDPTPLRLAEGLALHPHSRTVRWRPGTQFSYSNSGPAVAAYIVERITGQRFEDYVEQNIFDPLDMSTASYLLTDAVRERLATLYVGGRTPAPYWHISIRPAGSINASATDMAPFVRMLLNRGELDGTRIASADSIARMETATSTLGAAAGLEAGYGLANYSTVTDGFGFRGHNGGLAGGVADLGYRPEHGVGYALMLNSDSGVALQRIARVTRRFLTRDLEPPVLSEGRAVPEQVAEEFGGFYRLDTPRQELMRFLLRLRVGVVAIDGDRLRVGPIGGATSEYVAVSDRLARQTDQPITSLALIGDVDGRTRIQVGGTGFFKVPAWRAWAGTVVSLSSVLLMLSAVAFALIWVPRRFFGKLKGKSGIGVRAWPLLTVLLLVASFSFLATAGPDPTELGRPTLASVGFSVATVLFLFAACFGLYVVWNARALPINRVAYWHSASVATANACVAGYLLYWGIIGVRLWSF